MITFIILSALALGGIDAFSPRIVNGTRAQLGEIPYIVSIQRVGDKFAFCGGSIIDEYHVLTAAHCLTGLGQTLIQVQYGVIDIESEDNIALVAHHVYHPQYTPGGGYLNDIGVITLRTPIRLNAFARPSVLPRANEAVPENSRSVLAGWGLEKTGGQGQRFLQRVDLLIYRNDDCEYIHYPDTDRRFHICSGVPEGGKGQCSGDSGGPLYANGKQVGVVSWSKKPCGIKGFPGVFTRVSAHINWINQQL